MATKRPEKPQSPPAPSSAPKPASAPRVPLDVQRLMSRVNASLVGKKGEKRVSARQLNDQLDKLDSASMRAVTLYALRDGMSAGHRTGKPHQTAVSGGAMLVAQTFHREGVRAAELRPLLDFWKAHITSADLFKASEQLLGSRFCKLDGFPRGTPLAEFCEVLFGSAHEVGDLFAAGGIVKSIHGKLELLESGGAPSRAVKQAAQPAAPAKPKPGPATQSSPSAKAPPAVVRKPGPR